MRSSAPLTPTYTGYIASTQDALILFEACLAGQLNHVPRRPHDRERGSLIKSGNVFIYEEHSSGIKRWTDGVPWSPSRILGNFLIYRELEHAFPPGEKKRAMKRDKRPAAITRTYSPYNRGAVRPTNGNLENHRHLVGSLTDSYEFKTDGLVKKTISVNVGNVSHHLVSYYSIEDVLAGRFNSPSKDPGFSQIVPRLELTTKQSFRTPLDEVEPMDQMSSYDYARPGRYDLGTGSIPQQRPTLALNLPFTTGYSSSQGMYSTSFNMPSATTAHSPLTLQSSASAYSPYSNAPMTYPGPRTTQYDVASRPRYNSISTDMSPSILSSQQLRRTSAYDQGPATLDSANSISSAGTNESSYSHQGYYTSSREVPHTPTTNYNTQQRSLPSLPSSDSRQMSYDRTPSNPFSLPTDSMPRDTMWSLGNVSNSHNHFPQMQQSWAGAPSS